MMEPRRLIDDAPGELEAALLRAGREGRASSQARTRTLAALGIVGVAAVTGKSAAATLSAWSLKHLLIGSTVAVAAALGVLALTSTPRTDATRQSAPPAEVPLAPATEAPAKVGGAVSPPPATATGPTAATAAATTAAAIADAVAPSPTATSPAAPRSAPSASLAEELKSLDAARAALTAGDAAGALARLDEHARRFPRGGLSLEAEVMRIEALALSGDRAGAAARAKSFVERHPSSVFTPRVRRLAGE